MKQAQALYVKAVCSPFHKRSEISEEVFVDFSLNRVDRRWNYLVLFVFSLIVTITSFTHEPWYDEAQAWLLVRDSSFWDLVSHYLRYEGHPFAWYLLLWIPVHAGLPYEWINILPGLISIAGMWVFLRYSPFPFAVNILFPFGFFMMFQYGIIARSYCLFPLVLFAIAAIYHKRLDIPIRYVLLLILLSHISLHGTAIAVSLVCLDIIESITTIDQLNADERKERLIGLAFFLLSCILLALQLYLPDDAVVSGGKPDKNPLVFLNDGLTSNMFLTIVFAGITFLWLDTRHMLLTLLVPLSALLVLFSFVYKEWHQGIVYLLWIFVLWISYEKKPESGPCSDMPQKLLSILQNCLLAVLIVVLSLHAYWGGTAVFNDINDRYSATEDLAYYIQDNNMVKNSIFRAGITTVGILPYFDENIFCNFNNGKKPCFWQWSQKNPLIFDIINKDNTKQYLSMIQGFDPDYIIVDAKYKRNMPLLAALKADPKYSFVKLFEGNLYWKQGIFETEIYVLFGKDSILPEDRKPQTAPVAELSHQYDQRSVGIARRKLNDQHFSNNRGSLRTVWSNARFHRVHRDRAFIKSAGFDTVWQVKLLTDGDI